ncbi:MAG: inner membrane protein [Methanofollis sp.]|nr:inner membrane protein [Methanofollis sp.]
MRHGERPVKGDEHLAISLATAAVVLVPWISLAQPEWLVAALFGVFIGALAPDADANDSAIFHTRVPGVKGKRLIILPIFGYVIRYLVYYPISLPFIAVLGERGMPRHRGILHSAIGVGLMTMVLGIYAWVIGIVGLHIAWDTGYTVFLLGFLGGSVCHLLEDSCTRSGVAWLFPLSEHRTRGAIVTGGNDWRPSIYAAAMAAAAVGLFVAGATGRIPGGFLPYAGIALAAALWVFFLFIARFGR